MARARQTLKSSLEAHDRIPHMQNVRLLKDYVRAMWDVARKRMSRLNDPGVVGADLVGGAAIINRFGNPASSAGDDPVKLRQEYKRLYNFLTAQTSTPSGYKSWFNKQRQIWGDPNLNAAGLGRLWEAYNKAREMAMLQPGAYDSDQIARALGKRVIAGGAPLQSTADAIFNIAQMGISAGERYTADDINDIYNSMYPED